MGIFKSIGDIFSKKGENSAAYCMKMAKSIDGEHLKYVTERIGSDENVLAKDAHVNITDGIYLTVSARTETLFRARIDSSLSISHLLSGDGSILEGFDEEHKAQRKIVIYYLYYRK